jgi:hypothetical protein
MIVILIFHKDIAQVAAHVLSSKGPHGFSDKVRGQMMVVTGSYTQDHQLRWCVINIIFLRANARKW